MKFYRPDALSDTIQQNYTLASPFLQLLEEKSGQSLLHWLSDTIPY